MNRLLRLRVYVLIAATLGLAACGSVTPILPVQSNVPYAQTDLTVGTGAEAVAGKTATVQYVLWLYSETAVDHKGTQIDSGSFPFLLGSNAVIPGFEQAVTGMRVGGTRRATVPPALAYGSAGKSPVPPNAALVFEVSLTNVQ
jgi:FKBP-type peptidyl-prolyl cis-trans isomerase FkpA